MVCVYLFDFFELLEQVLGIPVALLQIVEPRHVKELKIQANRRTKHLGGRFAFGRGNHDGLALARPQVDKRRADGFFLTTARFFNAMVIVN
jgi:hypothetical protein